MRDVPVGHRAANLPWLCPAGPSLVALTDERPDPGLLAADPGTVLLVLRYTRPSPALTDLRLDNVAFSESILPEAAARHVASSAAGRIDLTHPATVEVVRFARTAARVAATLATRTTATNPAAAATAALLAPLGWLLVAAESRESVTTCVEAVRAGRDVASVQTHAWGMSHDGITRRVADRWKLPRWLSTVVTTLSLPVEVAASLGAPPGLSEVVRAAVAACETHLVRLGLTVSTGANGDRRLQRLAEEVLGGARQDPQASSFSAVPHGQAIPDPVLVRLLRTTARVRRAEAGGRLESLHAVLDRTTAQLKAATERFDERVRDEKLSALAELAAGAGHEINNPLAVISGNAQLLLAKGHDPESDTALRAIVRQTLRISEIVNDLMQYARPRPPTRRPFNFAQWIDHVAEEYRPAAAVKGIELGVALPVEATGLYADAGQLGRALEALLRNAIEAARTGGWVRVFSERRPGSVTVVVEDSGPGPSESVAEHMFDPFYSGRAAGRGRGLGLPTAWRMARENGGDVRYERLADGPTRFVLEVPLPPQQVESVPDRKSA